MSGFPFERGDRVRDTACQVDGTFEGFWTAPSGALLAVVMFDGERSRERVDPKHLQKVEVK